MKSEPQSPLVPITLLYLVLPSFLFAPGWLKPPIAALSLLVLAAFVVVLCLELLRWFRNLGTRKKITVSTPRVLKSLWSHTAAQVLLLLWLLLSGTGGFGFQHKDYRASNAIFLELITQEWPLHVMLDGIESRLVYYVAYYLPAAAFGKLFGWTGANIMLLAWTAVGTSLSFLWFLRLSRIRVGGSAIKIVAAAAIFCLAGGLDLIGSTFLRNTALSISTGNEWWAGYFQYSSNTTLIFWVPQQAIPGWLATGLVVQSIIDARIWRYLGITIAALALWSPLAVLGVAPFVAYSTWRWFRLAAWGSRPDRGSIIAAGAGALVGAIHLLYVGSNRFNFPTSWLWLEVEDGARYAAYYLAFCTLEFGLLAALVLLLVWGVARAVGTGQARALTGTRAWLRHIKRTFDMDAEQVRCLALALGVLLVLPSFSVGVYNDLAMRASIPALLILWAVVAKVLLDGGRKVWARHAALSGAILLVVLIGFYPAARNIWESVQNYHFGPPELSSVVSSANANPREIVEQRLGDEGSFFYRFIGK
jgi:hypothetical protein